MQEMVLSKGVEYMQKVVASDVSKENYRDVVNAYIEQLQKEQDITLFENVCGYYMFKGLVHELKLEDDQLLDVTYPSWSVEEKNFLFNVLDRRVIW